MDRDSKGRFIKGHKIQSKSKFQVGNKINVGRFPWNKNIPQSDEAKEKNRLAHLGIYDGEKNPFYGRKHSEESKRLQSESSIGQISYWKGKTMPEAMRDKMSKSQMGHPAPKTAFKKGNIPWSKDKTKYNNLIIKAIAERERSPEERKRMRLNKIARIQEQIKEGGQLNPFYNSTACEYFKWLDDNIFESEGQYATNGGEYYIKEWGYWLDYINIDLKVIIEWDEEHHYKNDALSTKDKIRQKEIESVFPDYDFIRIRESQLNYFMLCLLVAIRYKNKIEKL